MADLYAIGDLGDTTDDLLSYAQGVVDSIDPFAEAASVADALTNGGGDTSTDPSADVPTGEMDPSQAAGGFSFADQSSVVGAPAAVAAATGVQTPTNPGVVSGGGGGGGMVVAPSAPIIGPGTTTPSTGTPWVKYGIGVAVVGALAYFAWKWMNKRPKRANPKKRRKARR